MQGDIYSINLLHAACFTQSIIVYIGDSHWHKPTQILPTQHITWITHPCKSKYAKLTWSLSSFFPRVHHQDSSSRSRCRVFQTQARHCNPQICTSCGYCPQRRFHSPDGRASFPPVRTPSSPSRLDKDVRLSSVTPRLSKILCFAWDGSERHPLRLRRWSSRYARAGAAVCDGLPPVSGEPGWYYATTAWPEKGP